MHGDQVVGGRPLGDVGCDRGKAAASWRRAVVPRWAPRRVGAGLRCPARPQRATHLLEGVEHARQAHDGIAEGLGGGMRVVTPRNLVVRGQERASQTAAFPRGPCSG